MSKKDVSPAPSTSSHAAERAALERVKRKIEAFEELRFKEHQFILKILDDEIAKLEGRAE